MNTGGPPGQIRDWQFAAALLRGQEATGTYPDGHGVVVELTAGAEVPDGDVMIAMPLTVTVGKQLLSLGIMHVELPGATLVHKLEDSERAYYTFQTANRVVRHRLAGSTPE